MRGQGLYTFATKGDWTEVLEIFELHSLVKYVRSGTSEEPRRDFFVTFAELPNFGIAQTGDVVQEPRYLLLPRDSALFWESFQLKAGGTRYFADHSNNPDSVVFCPGGINFAAQAVISGEVTKLSRTSNAERMYRDLSKLVKRSFAVKGAYRVGKEAAALREQGYRLTSSISSPTDYDLV